MYSASFTQFHVIIVCCEDNYRRYCLQKVTMITSTHNLPLSSFTFISSVLHFLSSRINKLNRDFLNWQILSLLCLLRNYATLLLSHQFLKACKDGGYLELGLWSRTKYHVRIMLLFVYTTTRKRLVIFTCRYFKFTALSQSDCRNFSFCSKTALICNFTCEITKLLWQPFMIRLSVKMATKF